MEQTRMTKGIYVLDCQDEIKKEKLTLFYVPDLEMRELFQRKDYQLTLEFELKSKVHILTEAEYQELCDLGILMHFII